MYNRSEESVNSMLWDSGLMSFNESRLTRFFFTLITVFFSAWVNSEEESIWYPLQVPGVWEEQAEGLFKDHDGIAWYRCRVKLPASWKQGSLRLAVEAIDNAHEAYFNGELIGGAGLLPPGYRNGLDQANRYAVGPDLLEGKEIHWIALRVYDHEGRGGFKGGAPVLYAGGEAIELKGKWEFRAGDDKKWVQGSPREKPLEGTLYHRVVPSSEIQGESRKLKPGDFPTPPAQSHQMLQIYDDLEADLLLHEPTVAQPVFITFDERGRLWVVNYQQYPHPAGVEMVSRDIYWRAVYDKVPPPPPHHFKGRDRITIHEDKDGDGVYESHKTFVDGLNIATSVTFGRGGVWVLNPPYLLFYRDTDRNDVPDSAPEVHLSGFGLEDTHSVVNSLRWGPDGWLYAAQGSTVTAKVTLPGHNEIPVHTMGQQIWRYHPELRKFEVFAEGGGNTFGVEVDSKGRIFSGHNGGDTRGFHYVQGGYSRKGFSKHGPLSNPYAYGYFRAMRHHKVERFTHTFLIYEGDQFPKKYHGALFGVEPLQGRVVHSSFNPLGSTFQTKDLGRAITSKDSWFRPVDIKHGPDGALYVADWYDRNVNHYRNHEGRIDRSNGRIYRLKKKGVKPRIVSDLAKKSSEELVQLLAHPNRWHRQTALRLIGDRKDQSLIPILKKNLEGDDQQLALESLWALQLSGGYSEETVGVSGLKHANPFVRYWVIRFAGDDGRLRPKFLRALIEQAQGESHPEVRSQIASTAKRLQVKDSLALLRPLLLREVDLSDLHIPLLIWWGIEVHLQNHSSEVLKFFEDPQLWNSKLVQDQIIDKLGRRFAQAGTLKDLQDLARLFRSSPSKLTSKKILSGVEKAFQGRNLIGLPQELLVELKKLETRSDALSIRLKEKSAIEAALNKIQDAKVPTAKKVELARLFGEVQITDSVPIFLKILAETAPAELKVQILMALESYPDSSIGTGVLNILDKLNSRERESAFNLLSARGVWAQALIRSVEAGKISSGDVPLGIVRRIRALKISRFQEIIEELWGDTAGFTTQQMEADIQRFKAVVEAKKGDPYKGKKLYLSHCGRCHKLFDGGADVGPDLTVYQRTDLEGILLNIVNPSADIREGYENYSIVTSDGLRMEGFISDQNDKVVVLKGEDGQARVIEKKRILSTESAGRSLMPEGLLNSLKDQEIRDLFAYLRSTQPLNN